MKFNMTCVENKKQNTSLCWHIRVNKQIQSGLQTCLWRISSLEIIKKTCNIIIIIKTLNNYVCKTGTAMHHNLLIMSVKCY